MAAYGAQNPRKQRRKCKCAKQNKQIILYSYSISLHFPPNEKEGSIPFLELHSFVVYATVTHGIKTLEFICIKLISCLESLLMS
jgi:hypothetical protein